MPISFHLAIGIVLASGSWVFVSLVILVGVVGIESRELQVKDPLRYVDPLIGTQNGGNVFPGATIPYGMAKPGADTDSPSNQGGFVFDSSNITGFSLMHDSGTGGNPSLGNFALFPALCPNNDYQRCVFPKRQRKIHYKAESVQASPGYFAVELNSNIRVAMTATHHAALFNFTFPISNNLSDPMILLDLTDLADSRQDNGMVNVNEDKVRITGGAKFLPSSGVGSHNPYFCVDFKGAVLKKSGIWVNSRATTEMQNLTISRGINNYPLPGGGWIQFVGVPNTQILARAGISYLSISKACENAETEIPDWDFDETKTIAEELWEEKLSTIVVHDVMGNGIDMKNQTKMFYSGIYRTMINPQNYTNENPLWSSREPYFDSFYCLWDSFRSQIPFLTIIDPYSVAEMVRSLIDTYENEGWLPDCRMSLSKGYTQGGSNADMVLVDAFLKNISDSIDWDKGYAAIQKDAEVEPFGWYDNGRGGLDSWKKLGYIPVEDTDFKGFGTMTRSISRTLEYSANDYVIGIMANMTGRKGDAAIYFKRSNNWKNLFNADFTETAPTIGNKIWKGFFQPKYPNGTWGYQDPLYCSELVSLGNQAICSLQNNAGETFESSIWEYGFYVPHNIGALMKLYNGRDAYVDRLLALHGKYGKPIGSIGNEPSFLTAYQYHYAGRPDLSAEQVHKYIGSSFTADRDGIPGNDDSGAMGSFVAFVMMGLFPVAGQNVYLISAPFFPTIEIKSPLKAKAAIIRVNGFDPTYKDIYIQNVTLNGLAYSRNWITHSFFEDGGELVLTVGGKNSTTWGTRLEDVPPSLEDFPPWV
jgi:predicted alpha-1,2-mannosidase